MINSWSHLFDLVHGAYIFAIGPLFAFVFFGFALYVMAKLNHKGRAARTLRSIGPRKHRALQDHSAICAACGYPVAEATQCPECGAAYNTPGAVLHRDELESRSPSMPKWMKLAGVLFFITFAAWLLSPLGLLIGNRIEWGTMRVEEGYYFAEYMPEQATGAPQYTVQLSASYVVNASSTSLAPITGHLTFNLKDPVTNDLGWLQVRIEDEAWELHYFKGGIGPPSYMPTTIVTGVGLSTGIEELYKVTGFDQAWEGSKAELIDLQRLANIAIGPDFQSIEDASSLSHDPGGLVWGPMSITRSTSNWIKVRQPMPVSWIGAVLGLLVLSLPLLTVIGYLAVRVIRR